MLPYLFIYLLVINILNELVNKLLWSVMFYNGILQATNFPLDFSSLASVDEQCKRSQLA